MKYGTWESYSGNATLILAAVLLVAAIVLAYLGSRLHRRITLKRPGKFIGSSIVLVWLVSGFSFLISALTYWRALVAQVGNFTQPNNPISPITALSGLITFIVIILLTRKNGFKQAFVSAIVGTIAAPMIFELPFDLIVFGRTYPPNPAVEYTLLYFLPLFSVEISSFAMLSFSSAMKLSRYTLFALAGMFFVFAVWAIDGFGFPFTAIPTALNGISKVLAFAVSATLFLPSKQLVKPDRIPDFA
jgi:hypothetical protein